MKLVRLATAHFTPDVDNAVGWQAEMGDVTVSSREARWHAGGSGSIVIAEGGLTELPERSADGVVTVPEDARRALEHELERVIDLFALSKGVARQLASPQPCVALIAETAREGIWLGDAVRFSPNEMLFVPGSASAVTFDMNADILTKTRDRADGVKLLAEAMSQPLPGGRFHGCVRVFEHAFGKASRALVGPLSRFLSATFLEFTVEEISKWIVDVRHSIIHADLARQPRVRYDADTVPFLGRAQMAAFDVLLNKATWHDPSPTRRDLWTPTCGSIGPDGKELFIVQGYGANFQMHVLDPFGAYPFNLQAIMLDPPIEWWVGAAHEVEPGKPVASTGGMTRILEAGASLASTRIKR